MSRPCRQCVCPSGGDECVGRHETQDRVRRAVGHLREVRRGAPGTGVRGDARQRVAPGAPADDRDLAEAGYALGVQALVRKRGLQAKAAGIHGLVASAAEAAALRAELGREMVLVTPGIRPGDADAGDQKRVATPAQAIADGADYLVVGRPITAAADPRGAAEAIVREIAKAAAG